MAQTPPPPLDKGVCAVFEQMIEAHGYQYVITMAYADNKAGEVARRFFKQARRVTFIYHLGTWYSGSYVVDGPTHLTTLNPTMGIPEYPRATAAYKADKLVCDTHYKRSVVDVNGGARHTKEVDPDNMGPFVARPPIKSLTPAPVKARVSKKVQVTYTDKNGNLRKDAIDRELMEWMARQGVTL